MKNMVKLQHVYFPWELEAALRNFVVDYNNDRHHQAIGSVAPADVYVGRRYEVLSERSKIKQRAMEEGMPGHESGLGRRLRPSLGKERSLSEIS